jgi:hypothetical protein
MAEYITNGDITATDTAEDILPAGHNFSAVVLQIDGGGSGASVRFNVGANAGAAAGELLEAAANTPASATLTNLNGKKISIYGPQDTPWSIRMVS